MQPQFKNIQFIRVTEPVLLAKRKGIAKLVALYTNELCTVGGKTMSLGEEYTIEPGNNVSISPQGEFLFAE